MRPASVWQSTVKSMGLETCASMPAAVVAATSSAKALAVTATLGTARASERSSARIARAASQPSISGFFMSSRIASSEPGSVDAILLDMKMPEMDGCEAARAIRALDRADAREVPIVAVTANAFAEDVAATTAAGMDAHVSKPIDFTVLCHTLANLMLRRRGGEAR